MHYLYNYRCLLTCKRWEFINETIVERIPQRNQPTSEKEKPVERIHLLKRSFPRRPLSFIQTQQNEQTPLSPPLRSSNFFPHLRPCPNCSSPAKELNLRRAECLKCNFDFCVNCFKHWHEKNCGHIGDCESRQYKRSAINIAGNRSSKKRLRRL